MSHSILHTSQKNIVTRGGEDGLIEHIFSIIPSINKWCVEFGAFDGKINSNSWNLIQNHNWSAVLIEGHPRFAQELKKRYANHKNVHAIERFVQFAGKDTLSAILQEITIPTDFDFLSIDIDGADYHIWDSFTDYTPRVVMIECNLRIPPSVNFIPPRKMGNGIGSSLSALVDLGKTKGYELIYAENTNAVFVRSDLYPLFQLTDNKPETIGIFTETAIQVFQGFDGSLIVSGLPPTSLLLQKKKPNPVLYTLHQDILNPVQIQSDPWRRLKYIVKSFPLYYLWFDASVMKWYGQRWKTKKAHLEQNNV